MSRNAGASHSVAERQRVENKTARSKANSISQILSILRALKFAESTKT